MVNPHTSPPILRAHESSSSVERGEPIPLCEQKSGGYDSTNHSKQQTQDLFIETTTIDSIAPYPSKETPTRIQYRLGWIDGSIFESPSTPLLPPPTPLCTTPSTLIPTKSYPTKLSHALPRSLELTTQGMKIPRWVQRSDRTTDSVFPIVLFNLAFSITP